MDSAVIKIQSSQTEVSAVIEAQTPREGPVSGCVYEVSVSSHSITGEYIQLAERKTVTVESKSTSVNNLVKSLKGTKP